MNTISKKFLQKIANKFDIEIDQTSCIESDNLVIHIFHRCPELQPGEVIKPQEKWEYPIATEIPECGFVWFNDKEKYNFGWNKKRNNHFLEGFFYVIPDPNNPNKPPKKNWRPK